MRDALLIFTYGGPEGMAEVAPFLESVTAQREPGTRDWTPLLERYARFGGCSPLNASVRRLVARLREAGVPAYAAGLHAGTPVEDALALMLADGVERVTVFTPSPFRGYVRPYAARLDAACRELGGCAPHVRLADPFWDKDLFRDANLRVIRQSVGNDPDAALVFSAHALPVSAARRGGYADDALRAVGRFRDALGRQAVRIAWQSASPGSGRDAEPWLTPGLEAVLRDIATERPGGTVAVSPFGFVFENLETVYDLDVAGREVAESLGLRFVRVPTIDRTPEFLELLSSGRFFPRET